MTRLLWAKIRFALGFIFFWAFIDKLFGLGFGTCRGMGTLCERAWLSGGSPTTGFLSGADGWFSGIFNALAGQAWVDWLFMLGLLGIGIALLLGIAMNLAAWSGAILLILMWLAELPLANNPIIDDHIVYALVLVLLAWSKAGDAYGLGAWWRERSFVKGRAWLV